jgi:thioredoxin-related protein
MKGSNVKKSTFLITVLLTLILTSCGDNRKNSAEDKRNSKKDEYVREKFDPTRNPFDDLQAAIKKAQAENKRIILDVGGEWCIWCHRIDKFLHTNKTIDEFLNKHYIVVKVNYSKENKNEKFLSRYPKINGYPHFFVLDSDGTFLHSQNTGLLEEGKSYSEKKVMEFLRKWAK